MKELNVLPNEWTLVNLDALAKRLHQGINTSADKVKYVEQGYKILQAKHITKGYINDEAAKLLSEDDFAKYKDKYNPQKNQILFTNIGTIGRSIVVNKSSDFLVAWNIFLIDLMGDISSYFVKHYLENLRLSKFYDSMHRGGATQFVNKKQISSIEVPLPPISEQKVIADKLDSLLAQVETTKARLDHVPDILKRFRQSVLAAAVSGRLTEEWRSFNGGKSWKETVFSDICDEITVGFVGKMSDRYKEEGVPFLRSQNVRAFNFSSKNLLYISANFHQEIYKSRLEAGDLAIVRSGAPGTTCVVPKSLGIANCSDLVIARPSPKLNSEFGCIFMNSEVAQKNVSDNQVGVAQQHFNVGSMKKMPINLPPIEEQTEIVRRVEELFAFADAVEQKARAASERVNKLTQSILAKAFRGELTTDWRAANPDLISGENSAEALLEKIKAEREALKPKKKTRARKVKG